MSGPAGRQALSGSFLPREHVQEARKAARRRRAALRDLTDVGDYLSVFF